MASDHDLCILNTFLLMHDEYHISVRYLVGIGTREGLDDIVTFELMGSHSTDHCWDVSLQHNHRYYATVTAFHGGHDDLNVTAHSNGGKILYTCDKCI